LISAFPFIDPYIGDTEFYFMPRRAPSPLNPCQPSRHAQRFPNFLPPLFSRESTLLRLLPSPLRSFTSREKCADLALPTVCALPRAFRFADACARLPLNPPSWHGRSVLSLWGLFQVFTFTFLLSSAKFSRGDCLNVDYFSPSFFLREYPFHVTYVSQFKSALIKSTKGAFQAEFTYFNPSIFPSLDRKSPRRSFLGSFFALVA